MSRSSLLLLLLSACVRDLDVPAQPSTAPEALGELSGIYTLAFEWTPPGSTAPIEILHGSLMAVVHLEKPGEELEPVAGFILDDPVDLDPTLPTQPRPDALQFFSRSFYAAFDGENLQGNAEKFLPVAAVRAPGGGALLMDIPGLGICPRERGGDEGSSLVRARLVCAFDPSTSGVYRGTAGACEGGAAQTSYLGIGFFDDAALAMRYPEEAELAVLSYDLFRGEGLGISLSKQGLQATTLALRNEGDLLRLDMDVLDAGGACREHRSLTRIAGGESTSACALLPTPTADLEYVANAVVEGDGRFIDFRIVDASYPTTVFPAGLEGLEVDLQSTDGAPVLRVPDAQVPAGVSARFRVQDPAPRAGEPTRFYEALVVRVVGSGTGVIYQVAPLRCLRDRKPF